ncbi:MAG: MATE family efflux transporter [Faecalibacterium sp.]|nr:MATE family efflux transporter [Faecalibacterium sp.]
MQKERKTLLQLFLPIFLELLFSMLTGMVDTVMLSSVSSQAVGAVGTATSYLNLFIMVFSVISSGMIAVMTQYIGADQPGVAYQARRIGLLFNGALGVLLSVGLFFFAEPVADLAGIAPALRPHAAVYLRIVGGTSLLNALTPIFSNYLRAFGHTRPAMAAAVICNLMNLVLNAVFLYGFDMGVAGVALATALSRAVNLLIVLVTSVWLVDARTLTHRIGNRQIAGQILKIGLPSALESALYSLAVALVVRFLNQMDAEGINVTARSYAMVLNMLSACVGAALSQANAILTGWRIGAGEFDQCDKGTRKAGNIGILVSFAVAFFFAAFGTPILRLLTDDPAMIALVNRLLWIDVALEVGRAVNMVYGSALKTSGDALFTSIIGIIFMFLCAVGGTWLFGLQMGLMAAGAYIGMALDECSRAVCMYIRWKSGVWRNKALIKR